MLIKKSDVQSIIGKDKEAGRVSYLVLWKNKQLEQSSWELAVRFRNIK
jgi:hypothetical protein